MKIPAITFLLACALLGAGCSGGDEATTSGPNPTLTPMPDYTQEEIAAMKEVRASKEAARQQELQAVTQATSAPVRTIIGVQVVASPTP